MGFRVEQQKKLDAFFRDRKSVTLSDCEIKSSRQGEKMEIILKSSTNILKSDSTVDADLIVDNFAVDIMLSGLEKMSNFDVVNVLCKVIVRKDVVTVASGKKKQDILIADLTGGARVTLWEENIDALEEQQSYHLKKFVVREYSCQKYLVKGRDGSEMLRIDDIGEVDTTGDVFKEGAVETWTDVSIIAVPQLDRYKVCLVCKARVEPSTPLFGQCSKCGVQQRMDVCGEQISAKMLIMSNGMMATVSGFGKIVYDIVGVSTSMPVNQEGLMLVPPLRQLVCNSNKVILSVTRQ